MPPSRVVHPSEVDAELDRLAKTYRGASSIGLDVLNALGGAGEGMFDSLPRYVKDQLAGTTERALMRAMKLAHSSRGLIGDDRGWLNGAMAGVLGAAGGVGGTATALAEIPVTITLLLRVIQREAVQLGFDPASDNVQFDCVQVFGAAGPLARDDGADMSFVSARLALTSGAMQTLIVKITPKLAAVLGQKLAAQAVPLFGAAAGAAVNWAYVSYYRDISQVHFGLRKLAIDSGEDHDALVEALRARMAPQLTSDRVA